MCVCVYVCVLAHVCVYSLRIASSDKILRFTNTLIIIDNVLIMTKALTGDQNVIPLVDSVRGGVLVSRRVDFSH